jgi:hypothetical protein
MKAKELETILGEELGIGEAEMVQRFQKLRDMGLLPVSRGRNAEQITLDAVVSGVLSVVAERSGFAGLTTRVLRGLLPVGGSGKAFAQAETFAAAILAALKDATLLETVQEIRMTDNEMSTNSRGRGAILYRAEGLDLATYYVRGENLTLLAPGAETTYDPREFMSSMIREIVVFPQVLKRIAREVQSGTAAAFSLATFLERGGRSMLPPSHFAPNPRLDSELNIETDLEKLPQELGSLIIIPTSDNHLRREVEARGFFPRESTQSLVLMWRQFPQGALHTGPYEING